MFLFLFFNLGLTSFIKSNDSSSLQMCTCLHQMSSKRLQDNRYSSFVEALTQNKVLISAKLFRYNDRCYYSTLYKKKNVREESYFLKCFQCNRLLLLWEFFFFCFLNLSITQNLWDKKYFRIIPIVLMLDLFLI